MLHRDPRLDTAVVTHVGVVLRRIGPRQLVHGARQRFQFKTSFGSSLPSTGFHQCCVNRAHLRKQHDVKPVCRVFVFDDRQGKEQLPRVEFVRPSRTRSQELSEEALSEIAIRDAERLCERCVIIAIADGIIETVLRSASL